MPSENILLKSVENISVSVPPTCCLHSLLNHPLAEHQTCQTVGHPRPDLLGLNRRPVHEICRDFALIGRDPLRLCSDWLNHDVADVGMLVAYTAQGTQGYGIRATITDPFCAS